jgi:hypothetical protein
LAGAPGAALLGGGGFWPVGAIFGGGGGGGGACPAGRFCANEVSAATVRQTVSSVFIIAAEVE